MDVRVPLLNLEFPFHQDLIAQEWAVPGAVPRGTLRQLSLECAPLGAAADA